MVDLFVGSAAARAAAMAQRRDGVFLGSALDGAGFAPLFDAVEAALLGARTEVVLTLDASDGRRRAWLYEQGVVRAERQSETGPELTVMWTAGQARRFGRL